MNLPSQHLESLADFGYNEREAQFLYIAATFSGYFTQRQFLTFIQSRRGKRSHLFAQKVLNNGHATVRDYMGWGPISHLFCRTLYKAIGKPSLRNRREHSFEFIRTRLVLLDFLLSHPEHDYLETADDKVAFLRRKFGLSVEHLPAKVYEGGPNPRPALRQFVDGFPLFFAPPLPGLPPVVTFSYVDSGASGGTHFARHLATYLPLFRELSSFRFLFISPKPSHFAPAEERFHATVTKTSESPVPPEVLRYFEIRRKWEGGEYIIPVTGDLEFLNDAKRRFNGGLFEQLYSAWRTGLLAQETLHREVYESKPEHAVYFDTVYIPDHRSYLERAAKPGERGMKDTLQPIVHRSVHPAGERKY